MTKFNAIDLKRAKEKWLALERAKFNLRVQFERIDFKYDYLEPGIEVLKQTATRGELTEISVDD